MTQGGGGVYAVDGAMLVRQPNGVRAGVTVPTPQPGTYNYPAGRVSGHPEVFTLWAFIFNHPNLCIAPCDTDDLAKRLIARAQCMSREEVMRAEEEALAECMGTRDWAEGIQASREQRPPRFTGE